MDQVSDILVQRFSDKEIEMILYGLFACLLLALVGFVIGLWMQSSGGSFWTVLTKPIKARQPMRKVEEGDLRPLRRFDAYGTRRRKRSLWRRLWRALCPKTSG